LPIAALGLCVGLRAWSVKLNRESAAFDEKGDSKDSTTSESKD